MTGEDTKGVNNTFTYAKTGGVRTSSNSNVKQSYKYNEYGLVAEEVMEVNGCKYSIERSYDSRRRNTLNIYKKNGAQYKNQHFTYDDMNRPAYIWEMDDTNTSQAFNIRLDYDENSNLTYLKDSQCTRTYEYNTGKQCLNFVKCTSTKYNNLKIK